MPGDPGPLASARDEGVHRHHRIAAHRTGEQRAHHDRTEGDHQGGAGGGGTAERAGAARGAKAHGSIAAARGCGRIRRCTQRTGGAVLRAAWRRVPSVGAAGAGGGAGTASVRIDRRPEALTVWTHVNRAMTKLGVRDRAQLVVLAHESGLVTPRDG